MLIHSFVFPSKIQAGEGRCVNFYMTVKFIYSKYLYI